VAEVVIPPRLTRRRGAAPDRVLVDQHSIVRRLRWK
jgi:hypothetical protein